MPPLALARNTVWYGCVTLLGLASGLVMSVLLARFLGPERMGDFSYAAWILRVLETVGALGFGIATVRYTAGAFGRGEPGHAAGFLRLFMRAQLVWSATLTLAVAPLVVVFAPAELRLAYLAAVATLVPLTVEGIYLRAIYGAQRYDLTARGSAFKITLSVVATAGALELGTGVSGVLVAQGVVVCLSCALQGWYARSLYPREAVSIPAAALREARAFLVPLSAVMLLEMLVWDRTEVFFLRLYVTSGELGFYSLAYGLAGRLVVLPNIVVAPLLPALAALHGNGDLVEFGRVYSRAVRYAILVGAPLVAITGAVAPDVVAVFYGEAYAPVAWMFRVLIVVTLVGVLREVAWAALQAAGARRSILYGALVSTVIDLGLAVLLIPRFRTVGAIVAASAAQLALSLWTVVATRRMTGAALPFGALAKTATAAVVACAVTLATGGTASVAGVLTAATAGGVAFVIAGVLLGLPGREEWVWVRGITFRMIRGRVGALLSR